MVDPIVVDTEFMNPTFTNTFEPSEQCFNWALDQHIVHANNIGIYALIIPGLAFIMISLYLMLEEIPKYKEYQYTCIYFAKVLLLIFFIYYFAVVKYGLIS